MDDRKDKPVYGRDPGADDLPETGPAGREAKRDAGQIDCAEGTDFDIIFEFETPSHGPH
jgi:hypothetical protein